MTELEAIRARHSVRQYLNKPLKPDELAALRAEVDGIMPDWFKAGMEAVLLAPTAVNQQKFLFILEDGKVSVQPGPRVL